MEPDGYPGGPRDTSRIIDEGTQSLFGKQPVMDMEVKNPKSRPVLGQTTFCWFHGSSFKGFSIVFPAPRLAKVESSQKSNGMWFFRHFSRHICSTVAETIGVTNYAASFGAKNVQKTTFEAAKMMLGPWNQRIAFLVIYIFSIHLVSYRVLNLITKDEF